LRDDIGAERFDVFGTANFLNFMPWTASLEYLLDKTIADVQRYDDALVQQVIDGLSDAGYRVISPIHGPERSTLVVFTHESPDRNPTIHKQLEEESVHVAERDNKLRVSPHLYNTPEEIEESIRVLAKLA
jgi:selenocysteine lyase/cysteine desulfurase